MIPGITTKRFLAIARAEIQFEDHHGGRIDIDAFARKDACFQIRKKLESLEPKLLCEVTREQEMALKFILASDRIARSVIDLVMKLPRKTLEADVDEAREAMEKAARETYRAVTDGVDVPEVADVFYGDGTFRRLRPREEQP
jgi:hypothetical protein